MPAQSQTRVTIGVKERAERLLSKKWHFGSGDPQTLNNRGSLLFDRVERLYVERKATLGIVGMGYVGLPLTLAAAAVGYRVLGFDIDPQKVDWINRGKSYLKHIGSKQITSAVREQRLRATADFQEIGSVDAIIICVPTPLTANREPDLSFIERTTEAIAPYLRKDQLVVLESTTWPGTTVEVVKPILERTGLKCGEDFYLAFSPEREDPGNVDFSTRTIPKVVGGDDENSQKLVAALYGSIMSHTVAVSSTKAAEAVKLTENIFRAVNIALVNELKVVYDAMGIDVWEVIEAAKTKPFGYTAFYPGPGLGGHCIPIDPFYLTWKAREYEISTRFIELAGEINTHMPHYVVDKLVRALDRRVGRGLANSRILILGVAYKKNIDDIRESPALKLIELIEARGASVDYYDPHVPTIPKSREHGHLAGRSSVAWEKDSLRQYHAVVIATDHDAVDYRELCEAATLIIDTRNACQRAGCAGPNVIKA
jgi:UDP-N-acetyl-D-glucosamine dehydrogenase